MKNFLFTVAGIALLALCLLTGASFFLKSTVEDMSVEALNGVAGPDAETALEEVHFSPFSRVLTIRDFRILRKTPAAPLSGHADLIQGRVSWRGILACLPGIGSALNGRDSIVPIFSDLDVGGIHWANRECSLELKHTRLSVVRLSFPLLQQYLSGSRPPYTQAVDGVFIDKATGEGYDLTAATSETSFKLSSSQTEFYGLHGASASGLTAKGLTLETGGTVSTCRTLEMNGINITPAFLAELMAIEDRIEPTPADFNRLNQALSVNGPLVTKIKLSDLTSPLTASGGAAIYLKKATIDWSNTPTNAVEAQLRELRFPAQLVQNMLGFRLSGMDFVNVDADLGFSGTEQNRQHGLVRIRDLCDVNYDFLFLPAETSLRNLTLTFKDYSLTAQAARNISNDGHASALMLKAAAAELCSRDTTENKVQCRKLMDFIDAPGTLGLSTRKGKDWKILSLLVGCAGNFGSLFDVSIQPGGRTLSQQMQSLTAAPNH